MICWINTVIQTEYSTRCSTSSLTGREILFIRTLWSGLYYTESEWWVSHCCRSRLSGAPPLNSQLTVHLSGPRWTPRAKSWWTEILQPETRAKHAEDFQKIKCKIWHFLSFWDSNDERICFRNTKNYKLDYYSATLRSERVSLCFWVVECAANTFSRIIIIINKKLHCLDTK